MIKVSKLVKSEIVTMTPEKIQRVIRTYFKTLQSHKMEKSKLKKKDKLIYAYVCPITKIISRLNKQFK